MNANWNKDKEVDKNVTFAKWQLIQLPGPFKFWPFDLFPRENRECHFFIIYILLYEMGNLILYKHLFYI